MEQSCLMYLINCYIQDEILYKAHTDKVLRIWETQVFELSWILSCPSLAGETEGRVPVNLTD